MRVRIPDDVRIWLSAKYVQWAVNPSGPIWYALKLARRSPKLATKIEHYEYLHGRLEEDSRLAQESRKAPEGCEFEYLYFRLFEVFHLEDFGSLFERIRDHFPGLEDDAHPFTMEVIRSMGSIYGAGWADLGTIVRDRKALPHLAGRAIADISDLPLEVERIVVRLNNSLPSMIILTLDVHLTEDATKNLRRIQGEQHRGYVVFKPLSPWRAAWRSDIHQPSAVATRNALLYRQKLRSAIESCLRPILAGYFMKRSTDEIAHLPAIEVYALKGVPTDLLEFGVWKQKNLAWYSSLGISLSYFSYMRDDSIIDWRGSPGILKQPTSHLIILWDKYVKNYGSRRYGGTDAHVESGTVSFDSHHILDSLVPSLAVYELLQCARQSIEKLRRNAFERIGAGVMSRYRVRPYLRLSDALQRESVLVDRVAMEIEQQKSRIERDMQQNLVGFNGVWDSDERLSDILLESIESDIRLLKNALSLVRGSFSEHLATLAIRINFVLSLVVGAATLVGVAAVWDTPKLLFGDLVKLVGDLLKYVWDLLKSA